jgi:hypothetical protein
MIASGGAASLAGVIRDKEQRWLAGRVLWA